jgi:hypothetical protein
MSKHRGKNAGINRGSSQVNPPQERCGVDAVVRVRRSPRPLNAKAPRPVDQVEEASRGSFPCSDAPGYGHA